MALDQYDPEDDAALQDRRGGAIARLVPARGFGFIVEQPTGQEYFFHISDVENVQGIYALRDGDQVSFVGAKGPKGWRAEQIRLMSTASEAGRQITSLPRPKIRG